MPFIDPTKKRLTRLTTSPHITPWLRNEVTNLGYDIQEEDHVSVSIGATLADCMSLNLNLRTALLVLWLLKRFRCPSPKALYTHTHSFPWEELIPNDSSFSINSNVDHPAIDNSMYPNLVVKDAIVDRIQKRTGARPDSGSDRSKIVINLFWKKDRAWLYLNTSGQRLADRGYRRMPHSAPMQETLAAAVLLAAGYDGSQPLVNPMCGSGTLAIEAALIASRRAPGLLRANYSFIHTLLHNPDAWKTLRIATKKQSRSADPSPIIASDHDPRAIDAARRNATTAGVEHLIEFIQCDFADTPLPSISGATDSDQRESSVPSPLIILNPEYGERLGEIKPLEQTYARIGDFFKQKCPGYTGAIFTGNRELSKKIGLKTKSRIPFMNAKIECRLLTYHLYPGKKQSPPPLGEG